MDLQHEADIGDEHADDLTIEMAIGAIKRCEFVRYEAMTDGDGEHLGAEHHYTPTRVGQYPQIVDEPTENVIDLIRKAERIWWDSGRLMFRIPKNLTFKCPHVYPALKASCGYCGHTYHAGACELDGIPTYKAGRSA